jgi:hypothetical protein
MYTPAVNLGTASTWTPDSYFEWSDCEDVSWETARGFVLSFGKFKGETLGILVRTKKEREYLRYLLTWDKLREESEQNIRCVLQHYDEAKARSSEQTRVEINS